MKKVLIVNCGSYFVNGISNVICTYLGAFDSDDFCFYATAYGDIDPRYGAIFEKRHVRVIPVPNRRKRPFSYLLHLRSIIKREGIDVIHIHGNSGTMFFETFVAKRCGVRNIIVQSHNSSCSFPFLFGPGTFFTELMKKNATHCLAVSKLVGDWLFRENYLVVNNAIQIERFLFDEKKRAELRSRMGIADDVCVIGHVGCFNRQKNQSFLLAVFSEFLKINHKSVLILIGDGPDFGKIKRKASELGIEDNVFFLGKLDDVNYYYNVFDVFVLPSLWEGLGVVCIEAQANGLPCVVSDVVANDARCSDRFFVYDLSKSARSWAEMIAGVYTQKFHRDDELLPLISSKGFDINNEAGKLLALYNV